MRKLTDSELEDICSILELEQTVPFDVAVSIHENLVNDLRNQLQNILIYPNNIPLLKEKIQKNYVSSRVQPGEMVGCIAASSIGEQNTQASLNSFHSAGIMKANLTDGISRLDELISANKNMKTPSCTFYFKNIDNTDLYQVKRLCNMHVIYHDILACVEKYMIHYKYNFTEYEQKYVNFFTKFYKRVKLTEWSVRFYFQKTKLYNINKTIEDICKLIELKFPDLMCIFYPENKMYIDVFVVDNILDPSEIIKKGVSYNIEYEEKKDKRKDKKEKEIKDCGEYDPEDDTEIDEENIEEDEGDIEFLSVEDNSKTLVDDNNKMYFYLQDVVIPSILILPLTGIKNIKECYYNEDSKGKWFVQTKGSNLLDLLTTEIIDFRNVTSNNMNEVYQILGIEATKQFITDEFYKIINVSKRHLQILVSAMTFFGTISPVSRYGMNPMAGILTKISFEQPFDNLISSACLGVKDHISGVSSSITIGKLARFGTGMIDVIEDKSKIPVNHNFDKEIDFEKYLAKPNIEPKKINKKSQYIVRKPTINNIVCEKDKSMSVLEIKSSIIKKSIHNKIEMYDEEIL